MDTPYFDGDAISVGLTEGTFHYMSARDTSFGHRQIKGSIIVSDESLVPSSSPSRSPYNSICGPLITSTPSNSPGENVVPCATHLYSTCTTELATCRNQVSCEVTLSALLEETSDAPRKNDIKAFVLEGEKGNQAVVALAECVAIACDFTVASATNGGLNSEGTSLLVSKGLVGAVVLLLSLLL